MDCKFGSRAETNDAESAADWEGLNEQVHRFLSQLHPSSLHAAAAINNKNKVEVFSLLERGGFRSFRLDFGKLLRVLWFKSRNEARHARHFIALLADFKSHAWCRHVLSAVENVDVTFWQYSCRSHHYSNAIFKLFRFSSFRRTQVCDRLA